MFGTALYASTSFFALRAFKAQQWGWVTITWNALQLAVSLFLSFAVFSEPFTTRRRIAALLVLGAILLSE